MLCVQESLVNKVLSGLLVLTISFYSNASEKPKYKLGDCITPTNINYSWFGKFAKVEAFSIIDGFPGENYILLFSNFKANSVIFSQSIESNTKKIDDNFCELNT